MVFKFNIIGRKLPHVHRVTSTNALMSFIPIRCNIGDIPRSGGRGRRATNKEHGARHSVFSGAFVITAEALLNAGPSTLSGFLLVDRGFRSDNFKQALHFE
ncbi:hypothetical protein F442_11409 [Phytophthora nicotianae P10297]|uniref:Uncharacterized protein n=4 Tax=Phytophthora nicotianae TaxID=4792 RepID=V9EW63_PHYNI|nr:hypothetical protein F443_11514 [Phytophthora nicotianae P1569]ETK83627.1 hypothetical protein L915_11209 [Phytophthora nicotianae]ETO72224.1 hypothetical protein F444_11587 [Phytophthora nicotianae P1976]ETP41442.1 hypothetical protein F442_11409 [Phytophthora nicotianae P10297]ETL37043.1 hypothetical protein L916_11105 [Phytophthora nicotianae]